MKKYPTTIAVVFLMLVMFAFIISLWSVHKKEDPFTYTQLKTLLRDGKSNQLSKVTITNGESIIQVQLAGSDRPRNVIIPSEVKESLINEIDKAGISLEVREPDKSSAFWFSTISSFFLPILLLVGFLFMFRSAQSGGGR